MSKVMHTDFNLDGYKVTPDGRVYSEKSKRYLSCWRDKQGYVRCRFNGITYFVHRVVATLYLDNQENKPEVNHKNGDTSDNRVENLEWSTRSENQQHAFDNKFQVMAKGSKSPVAVLTYDQACEIRRLHEQGYAIRRLGRLFGVSQRTAQRVVRRVGYQE